MSDTKRRHRSRSPSPRRGDWRNVQIKEEPMSDVEGSHRDRHVNRDRSDRTDKYENRDSSRNRRSRSRERDREFSSSRGPPPRSRDYYDRDRRDRDGGGDRGRRDYHSASDRTIKRERRSRSRSPQPREEFARPHPSRPQNNRRDYNEPHNRRPKEEFPRRNRDERGDNRPRDPKREQDWDQFFNPNSSMSQNAMAKRDENQRDQGEEVDGDDEKSKNIEKEKPNFGLSGKLTAETNTFKGVVIKYSEPPEARKPIKTRWRLYPFKDNEALEVMYIHRQSAYLLGRERKIADIPIDHPSCSKQHAVIQYRLVPYTKPNGSKGRRIRPYVIDLESANGTIVNGKKIDPKRYVELFEKDVLKFGFSSREYVLLHEHSKDDSPLDDDGYVSPTPD